MSVFPDPELSQDNCQYSGPLDHCPYCGKEASTIPSVAPPPVGSNEWVEKLAERWERRAGPIEAMSQDMNLSSLQNSEKLGILRTCIRELRACAESSSTEKVSDR